MAADVTPDGAFPELFSEFVDFKRNLGYVYPGSRLYLVRRLSRFLAGRATDQRVLTKDAAEEFARPRDGESAGSAAGRRGIARQFALFLRWKGIEAWVLPEHSQPRTQCPVPDDLNPVRRADQGGSETMTTLVHDPLLDGRVPCSKFPTSCHLT
jgi:hypothetical protein